MPKIKLIIFDAYGVIIKGGYPKTMKVLAKRFKRNWQDLHQVYYTKYFNQAAERKITQKEAWIQPTKELKLPISWQEVRNLHYSFMKPNSPVINLVQKLRKKYTTLLLSKNTRTQFYDVQKTIPLKKYFDYLINTYEWGLPKASAETIRFLQRRFGVKISEMLYIDDQKINLKEAKKMGVKTIFYQNFKQFKRELKKYKIL